MSRKSNSKMWGGITVHEVEWEIPNRGYPEEFKNSLSLLLIILVYAGFACASQPILLQDQPHSITPSVVKQWFIYEFSIDVTNAGSDEITLDPNTSLMIDAGNGVFRTFLAEDTTIDYQPA